MKKQTNEWNDDGAETAKNICIKNFPTIIAVQKNNKSTKPPNLIAMHVNFKVSDVLFDLK